MISSLGSQLTHADFSTRLGHSAVFLNLYMCNTLYSCSSSLNPGELIGTGMTKMLGINCDRLVWFN